MHCTKNTGKGKHDSMPQHIVMLILIKVSGTEDTLVEINKLGVTIMESVINSGKFLINEENEIYFGKQKQNNKAS